MKIIKKACKNPYQKEYAKSCCKNKIMKQNLKRTQNEAMDRQKLTLCCGLTHKYLTKGKTKNSCIFNIKHP